MLYALYLQWKKSLIHMHLQIDKRIVISNVLTINREINYFFLCTYISWNELIVISDAFTDREMDYLLFHMHISIMKGVVIYDAFTHRRRDYLLISKAKGIDCYFLCTYSNKMD